MCSEGVSLAKNTFDINAASVQKQEPAGSYAMRG